MYSPLCCISHIFGKIDANQYCTVSTLLPLEESNPWIIRTPVIRLSSSANCSSIKQAGIKVLSRMQTVQPKLCNTWSIVLYAEKMQECWNPQRKSLILIPTFVECLGTALRRRPNLTADAHEKSVLPLLDLPPVIVANIACVFGTGSGSRW